MIDTVLTTFVFCLFLLAFQKIRYVCFLIKTIKKARLIGLKTFFFSHSLERKKNHFLLVKLLVPVHSHFNPVICPRRETPLKTVPCMFCWKSLGYWVTLSVWPHMTFGLQLSSEGLSAILCLSSKRLKCKVKRSELKNGEEKKHFKELMRMHKMCLNNIHMFCYFRNIFDLFFFHFWVL